jgi:hypothetical protein
VIAQVERAAGISHADEPVTKVAKLRALLAAAAPPREDVAVIAELCSLPSDDVAPPLDLSPQRKKGRDIRGAVATG